MHTAKRLAALALLSLVAACGGSPISDSGRGGIPSALRERSAREEVRPFTGFTVIGMRLFRASGAAPDLDWSYVVGVDAQDRVYEGPTLMARLGTISDEVFADRALAILMREAGSHPLDPTDPKPMQVSAEEWSIVTVPHRVEGSVVFFAVEGQMSPTLNEVSIDRTTYAVTRRPAADVLLASGRTLVIGTPVCQVYARCGCYDGCKRFTTVRIPSSDALHYRVEGGPDTELYTQNAPCTGEGCARVCRADTASADCGPLLVSPTEACTESCPPTEAPYHCEPLGDGCRQVPHPTRVPPAR